MIIFVYICWIRNYRATIQEISYITHSFYIDLYQKFVFIHIRIENSDQMFKDY
jgi:hypothetical protein